MSDPNEIPLGPEPTPPPPHIIPPSASASAPYAAPPSSPTGLPYAGPEPTPDAKTMAMLAHLLNITLLGPLIIYFAKKDEHPFIADQARESLNFALCCFIARIALVILPFIHLFCIASLLQAALSIAQLVLGIIGGLKARDGFAYRYPMNVQFIK